MTAANDIQPQIANNISNSSLVTAFQKTACLYVREPFPMKYMYDNFFSEKADLSLP